MTDTVQSIVPMLDFEGARFAVPPKVALMPLLRFAHMARQGVDADEMEGMDAIYAVLRACIADEDWARFEDHASLVRADMDDLLKVVGQCIELVSGRPTSEPSDSSDGSQPTSDLSADGSSSAVIHHFEQAGRPSIALMVAQAAESRASA